MVNADLLGHKLVGSSALAVGALGLAAAAGLAAGSGRGLAWLPIAFGAAVILLVGVGGPGLGVALLPAVSVAVPLSLGTGTQSRIVAGLIFAALLLGTWALQGALARDLKLVASPVNAPTLAFGLVWVLAYLYSDVTRSPLIESWATFGMVQVGQMAVVLVSAGVLLLALNAGRDPRWIQVATWAFLGLGALALVAMYLHLRPVVMALSTLGLFAMWAVALSWSQALFNEGLPRWLRLGLASLALGWTYTATFGQTIWFSGWMPSLVALLVITFARSKPLALLLLVAVGTACALNADQLYRVLWVDKVVGGGDLTRLDIWRHTWQIIQMQPLLGTGPAGYALYNRNLFADSPFALSTHSNYLDVLAQTGFVGAAIFAWLLASLLVVGRRACRQWRSNFAGAFARGASGGLLGLLVAMALGDWLIPFAYNQTIGGFRYTVHSWVFLGFLASLAAMRPRPEVR